MPNKPRPENPHRSVRVEDDLWEAARVACVELGTTRAKVMQHALRRVVEVADNPSLACEWACDDY